MRKSISFMLLVSFMVIIMGTTGFASNVVIESKETEVKNYEIDKFTQAPILDEKVQSGKLPSVDERLPEDPYVVDPLDSIGKYGGTANTATIRPNAWGEDIMMMDWANSFIKPTPDGKELVINFAKKFEISEDMTTYTIHLRKGVKWSDGNPFDANDIMFWYEDVLQNKELTPVIAEQYKSKNGELMDLSKLDNYTIQIKFNSPKPYFKNTLVHSTGWNYLYPSHYLKQFHPKYTDEKELKQKVEEKDFDQWYELFQDKNSGIGQASMVVNKPTLGAYTLVHKTSDRRVYERNPYFWKVDSEGNQLPYIDKIACEVASSKEIVNGMMMSGDTDFLLFQSDIRNYPMFKKYEDKGGYNSYLWRRGMGSDVVYMLNHTNQDSDLRKIFQKVEFKKALSLGMNREEINEAIYFGRATPAQYTVIESSQYYKPEYEEAYSEYNPEKAKELLNGIGLVDKDGDGWRDLPDGDKFTFTIEYTDASAGPKTPNIELVTQHWQDLGINVNYKLVSGELQSQRAPANMMDGTIWNGDTATDILFPANHSFTIPRAPNWGTSIWPEWGRWFSTDGAKGEEPPAKIKQIREWYEKIISEPDKQKRIELGQKILQAQAENLWVIGTVNRAPIPVLVSKDMKNIPETGLWAWDTCWSLPFNPSQFYFDK